MAAGALGGPLAACGGAPVPRPLRSEHGPPRTLWRPLGATRATVVLVHGLGTRATLWDLPGSGGLAPALAREGYTVVAPDLGHLDTLARWRAALAEVVETLAGPVVALGLDLGGTAIYGVPGLAARIGIGAPIASGGFSAAMRGVLTAPGAPSWQALARRTVGGRSIVRLVLTDGMPASVHRPLVRDALSPMPLTLRRSWFAPGAGSPVPTLLPDLPAMGAGWGPTLVVAAPGDGLAPPWQCDPRGFGIDWPGLELQAPSRVNGHGREFNHLDLAAHPDARRRVWPSILAWMAERIAQA